MSPGGPDLGREYPFMRHRPHDAGLGTPPQTGGGCDELATDLAKYFDVIAGALQSTLLDHLLGIPQGTRKGVHVGATAALP